jgi:hypothetical protein
MIVRVRCQLRCELSARSAVIALATVLPLAACGPDRGAAGPTNESIVGSPTNSTPKEETSPVKTGVPKGILDPILNEAAPLARIPREQLVIVRAEPVVWSDGSLCCSEPGMEYAQTLVNGYWVVINAAGQTYDFRAGRDGRFRLCPQGRGRPPLPSNAQ